MSIHFALALSSFNCISMSSARVLLALYALHLGADVFAVGVLAATFALFPMLLGVTTGQLADRFGAKWLLIIGAIGSSVGMLAPVFYPSLPALFIAGIMSGFSVVFYNVSTQNLVGLMSKPSNRAKNFSNYALTKSGADLLGPLIAGITIDQAGHATACVFVAVLTFIPVIMLAARGKLLPGGRIAGEPAPGGVRTMLRDAAIRKVLVTGTLLVMGTTLYQIYLPVYGYSIGLSASVIGVILAINASAAFVVRMVLARLIKRYSEERLLAYAFFVGAASLATVPLFTDPMLLGVTAFVFGLSIGCGQPIVSMLIFACSPPGRSGEALGLKVAANQLSKVASPVVFGFIASIAGLPPTFWLNALLLTFAGYVSGPRRRDREKPPGSPAP